MYGNSPPYVETTTALLAGATFTGGWHDLGDGGQATFTIFGAAFYADVAGTCYIDASSDQSIIQTVGSLPVSAGTPKDLSVPVRARYYRVRYVNGATNQGTFNIFSGFTPGQAVTVPSTAGGSVVSAIWTPAAAAYSAGDVMGATSVQSFNFGTPGERLVTSVVFEIDATALQSGEGSYSLELYNVTPPSAYADNAAWDLPSGDRAAHMCSIPLSAPVDKGSTLKGEYDSVNKQITVPPTGIVFGYLVTNTGFTATAVARAVALHSLPV